MKGLECGATSFPPMTTSLEPANEQQLFDTQGPPRAIPCNPAFDGHPVIFKGYKTPAVAWTHSCTCKPQGVTVYKPLSAARS